VPEDHLWLVSLWPPHVSVSGPLPRAREHALLGMASLRCGAYRVFTRKRAILVSSVKILRTRLDGAGQGDFAHNNLRSGRARRPVCQLYNIRNVSRR